MPTPRCRDSPGGGPRSWPPSPSVRTASRSSSPTIRSPASPRPQDASGAQPWDIDLFYDLTYNLFVTPRRVPAGHPRRRTSTRSTRCPTRAGSPTASARRELTVDEVMRGPVGRPGAGPVALDDHPREERGRRARASPPQDAKGQTWFVSFDPPSNPGRRDRRRSWSPRRSSGRSATTRSSTS